MPAQAENKAATESVNPKDLAGRAKPQLHLVPLPALLPISRVMELGAKKYGPFNWRDTPIGHTPYISAMFRHLIAFASGEDLDPESGQPHLAHIASGAMILLDAREVGSAKDDRPGLLAREAANENSGIPAEDWLRRFDVLTPSQLHVYWTELRRLTATGGGVIGPHQDQALLFAEMSRPALVGTHQ